MDQIVLRLLPRNEEPQELVLKEQCSESSILDAANSYSSYVFRDFCYSAQIISEYTIKNPALLLNGYELEINYNDQNGLITFHDPQFDERIFAECYGFAQMTLLFDDNNGNRYFLESEYIQIMVRRGDHNESVRRMTEYVYSHNMGFFNNDKAISRDIAGLRDSARNTLESHILLLEKIAVTYEENHRYFKANSRFTTVPKERVDRFDHLQHITGNTIQHIVQHPEELHSSGSSVGIRLGNSRYLPYKTLVTSNETSFDIYENRVILGFLRYLLHEVERMQEELKSTLSKVPQKIKETGDYVTSSYFIYANTIEMIKVLLNKIDYLQERLTSLFISYSEILPVKAEIVSHMPKFTPVFKSVPQYHEIYECAAAWFTKGVLSMHEEHFMLSFVRISTLYEYYVLAKLINYFADSGFDLLSSDKINYPSPGMYFENTKGNNTFVLDNGSCKVTVYYQPVIYNTNREAQTSIGLYRNTSISFPKRNEQSGLGRYYTPDYIIKYEYPDHEGAEYLIADAKFSSLETIKTREVAELAYKYLFSVAPLSATDKIIGLCIFGGQSFEPEDSYTNIYDFELEVPIEPVATIVTLTENSEDNIYQHNALLSSTVGKFTSKTARFKEPKLRPNQMELQTAPMRSDYMPPSSLAQKYKAYIKPASMPEAGFRQPNKQEIQESKKNPSELSAMLVSELMLDKDIERRLAENGVRTVADLVPNLALDDLAANPHLNRKTRRQIDARLRQKKIYLH